jgi:hypothetical protein
VGCIGNRHHPGAEPVRERGCERIGLVMGWNDMEYPLWPLLHDGGRRPHLAHVNVNNAATATDRSTTFSPCLVVSVDGQRIRIETRD